MQHRLDLGVVASSQRYTALCRYGPAIKPACADSDQARVGARHRGDRQPGIYARADSRFRARREVTLVGSADLASLAEAALNGVEVADPRFSAELTPCFAGDNAERPRAPTPWCWPAPTIRCWSIGSSNWRHGRSTGSILRPRSRDGSWICSGPPARGADRAGAAMIFTSGWPHALSETLMPFFGGRVPA